MRNAPKLPRNTCPDIDRVIHGIDIAVNAIDAIYLDAKPSENMKQATDALKHLDGLDSILEELRVANQLLREYGEHWSDRAEELTKEADDLGTERNALDREKRDLEEEVEELRYSEEVSRRALVG